MVKYILTDKNLRIIDQRNAAWQTPGEYDSSIFNIVICDCEEDKKVSSVTSLGSPETETLNGHQTTVYRNAVVEYEVIEWLF